MRTINQKTLFILTVLFGFLLIPSFLVAFAKEEGTLKTNFIWDSFDKLYSIFRFPTHILLESVMIKSGKVIFFAGLLINCLFYGIVTERLIYAGQSLRMKYMKKAAANSRLAQWLVLFFLAGNY